MDFDPELPFFVTPTAEGLDVDEYIRANVTELKRRLARHGAILFRGWSIFDAEAFLRVATAFGVVLPDMACSAGPRIEIIPGVYTANEAPSSEIIPFHHEMAQCLAPPAIVAFHCMIPPHDGGATPIIHSSKLAQHLQTRYSDVANRIREKQIRYVRELPPVTDMGSPLGKSWKVTLHADTKAEAEAELRNMGMEWTWLPDDRLRTIGPRMPMFVTRRGVETLFTAAETAFLEHPAPNRPEKTFVYGDGSPLDPSTKRAFVELGRFAFDNSARVQWRRGDVLIIDNATIMHARDPFTPPRKVLVSLLGKPR